MTNLSRQIATVPMLQILGRHLRFYEESNSGKHSHLHKTFRTKSLAAAY